MPTDGRSGRTRDRTTRHPNGGIELYLVLSENFGYAESRGNRISYGQGARRRRRRRTASRLSALNARRIYTSEIARVGRALTV